LVSRQSAAWHRHINLGKRYYPHMAGVAQTSSSQKKRQATTRGLTLTQELQKSTSIPEALPAPQIGAQARSGFVWLMAQTLVGKIVNSVSIVVAGWYLLPQDYKLASLAFPLTMFISVMQQLGVDKVLVARGGEFRTLANAGFWMSAAAGILCGLVILAGAPVAAWAYHQPALLPLLSLLALAAPLNGIVTVHGAYLQLQMRFKFLAATGMAAITLQAGLIIVLSWAGWGAYALIVPALAQTVLRFVALVLAVRLPLSWNPEFPKWRSMIRESIWALGAQFNLLVAAQGDFLLIGLIFPSSSDQPGYFSFAFNLSIVIITPLVINMGAVIFPALCAISNDPRRQTEAFLRACRRVAAVGTPLCLLQAAVAAPLLHAMYGSKWDSSILCLQVLSVCMAVRLVCVANYALFSAQGRFFAHFVLSTIYALLFLGSVAIAAWTGSILIVAIAETVFFIIFDNLNLYMAIRGGYGHLMDIVRLYSSPLATSLLSVVLAWAAGHLTFQIIHWYLLQVAVIGVIFIACYFPLVRWLDRPSFNDIVGQARGYLLRFKRRPEAQI